MARPRWSRALRVLTEEERNGMALYMLACYGAECQRCDWRGPLRDDRDVAGRDGIEHLRTVHGDGLVLDG